MKQKPFPTHTYVERILKLLEVPFVREYLVRLGGDAAPDVVTLVLEHGNNVTDELIANEMGVKVTVVRAVFNRLHFWGVMDYDRTRDEETGWYTYTWHFLPEKFYEAVLQELKNMREELKEKLAELENVMLFQCPKGHARMPFEVAMEYGFRCPECGEELEPVDVQKKRQEIRRKIDEIRRIETSIRNLLRASQK